MNAWRAKPYDINGVHHAGKVHWVRDSEERTLCGKWLKATPGQRIENAQDRAVTCLICRNKVVNDADYAKRQERYARENAQREAQRVQESKAWWAWYNGYLESPQWKRRRQLALERDGGICQGCRVRKAVQVHHLTYERVGNEMLFDLVSVCLECHERIPPRRRAFGGVTDY